MTQSTNPKDPRASSHWFPNASLGALRQEMNDLFENFFGDALSRPRWDGSPCIDVMETAEAVEVAVDVPGFKPEEINVEVAENSLVITGKPSTESKQPDPDKKIHRLERRLGNFSRTVWLPCPVQEDKIDAKLDSGVLKISLPKREEARRRKILVHGAGNPQS